MSALRLSFVTRAFATLVGATAGLAQSTLELDPVVSTATRVSQPLSALPVTVDVFSSAALAAAPSLTLDDTLKASAAFSLFRRTGSLSANPTAQGVSLRNLGPNGAGRTLVLLDGIPLNDPFGGWVVWTKAPRLTLAGVEIVRGGGSSTWGSAALGGTIQLFSTPPESATNRNVLQVEAGAFGSFGAELAHTTLTSSGDAWQFDARGFHSDGFARGQPEESGPIDRPTDLDQASAQLGWTHHTAGGTTATVSARSFTEERGNGTPAQRNRTREAQLAAHAHGTRVLLGDAAIWATSAYVQTQTFANRFTSIAADRASETPALDQYAVPADAAGAVATVTWSADPGRVTTVGSDVRWARGETREYFLLSNGAFARERRAGGTETIAGLFAQHDRALDAAGQLRASAAVRLDRWELTGAHRRETDRATGNVVRADALPDRDGLELSPRTGLVLRVTDRWRLTTSAYSAFRVPTLNELYRPFRVGNVITEANPDLKPETLRGLELGATWTGDRGSLRINAFANNLADAVANVTLGAGPGNVPGVGFVPAGGLGRRRENIAAVRVRGLEVTGRWQPTAGLGLRADYLLSDATDPAADRRLPQASRHTVVLGADWTPGPAWRFGAQLRYLSEAFEDDENTLPLDAVTTVDLRLSHPLGGRPDRELFVAVENVFDATVIAGRAPDGRVDLGTPRFTRAGLRWAW